MAYAALTGPQNSTLTSLFGPQGQRLFQGTLGSSPYNAGTAAGIMPSFGSGFVGQVLAGAWNSKNLPFQAPQLTNIARNPLSLLARRRLAGQSGVGSTFLTGNGGVRPGNQTLGYSTLLGS